MHILKKIIVFILTIQSRLILARYHPFIIAVTGSVGKTSTKDAIYCIAQERFNFVRRSEKSMNSEIGLPLTIIGVPNAWRDLSAWLRNIYCALKLIIKKDNYPDCLILEVGADHPGDIKRVAHWLSPHIAVLTKVSTTPVHVEFFKSPEQVFEEKIELIKNMRKGGTAIVYADQENTLSFARELEKKGISVITYGSSNEAGVRGSDFAYEFVRDENSVDSSDSNDGSLRKILINKFNLNIADKNSWVTYRNPLGKTGMFSLLPAAAIGHIWNIDIVKIANLLGKCEAPKGRMFVIPGINDSMLIDDSYNSSPDACILALQTLQEITCSRRKIVVLGDMLELGKYSSNAHRNIGKLASSTVNVLVTVGYRAKAIAEEAILSGLEKEKVFSFDSSSLAADFLHHFVQSGDIVLVKGSQSMRMERVCKAIMANPNKARELLVRQEDEWLEKP